MKTQVIDVSRSFIITDPEAFYENLMSTVQEDSPERLIPIVAYEGYNILPTIYGYRSYFDITSKLDVPNLGARCDKLLLYQFGDYTNCLIAFCENGIYTNAGKVSGTSWYHSVTVTAPPTGSYKEWTYCVIENVLYFYRQGDSLVYYIGPTDFGSPINIHSFTPSFLNMAGQMGIFRANGRLGFWDSANSISWSSVFDVTDFTPSIETLAGDVIFNDVLGRIVTIKASGSGFVIYSTKNIVGAQYDTTGSILFNAKTIAETAGIWISKQVCAGVKDTEHYAYTNTGIRHISNGEKVTEVFSGLYDFLKEAREPVYMDYLQGRYLFFSLIDPSYVSGLVSFSIEHVSQITIRLKLNNHELVNPLDVPDFIDGIPFADALLDAIQGGATDGMYGIWNATGSKLIPGRVSSMDPYELDDPFTPEDDHPYAGNLAVLYSTTELETARDSGIWNDKFSVDNTKPFALDLGWHNCPLGTGQTDDGLTRIQTRQNTEWSEYVTLFNAFLTKVNQTAQVAEITYDPTIVVMPAHGGPTLTSSDTSPTLGYIKDPTIGVTTTAVFSGVGTYAPSYELKKVYTKDRIIRRRLQATEAYDKTYYGCVFHFVGSDFSDYPGFDTGQIPNLKLTNVSFIESTSYAGLGYSQDSNFVLMLESSVADANSLRAYAETFIPQTLDAPGGQLVLLSFYWIAPSPDLGDVRAFYGPEGGEISQGAKIDWTLTQLTATNDRYHTRKTTTIKTLLANTTQTGSTVESKLVANQRIVDWAEWTVENPPPTFDWATNEQIIGDPGFKVPQSLHLPPTADINLPGATFLLQDATSAPIYPDYVGALVYDTGLQKWGKFKGSYRTLVDYSPINSTTEKIIDYSNFGLDSGILSPAGSTHLFSSKAADSLIRYGKLALYRQGFTNIETITLHFRKPFTGSIQIDVSLDGRSLHSALTTIDSFTEVGMAIVYPPYAGKWFTVSIKGEFDLRSFEFNGNPAGIR